MAVSSGFRSRLRTCSPKYASGVGYTVGIKMQFKRQIRSGKISSKCNEK